MQVLSSYDNHNDIDGMPGSPWVQSIRTIALITEREAALPEHELVKLITGDLDGVLSVQQGLKTNRLYAKVLQY